MLADGSAFIDGMGEEIVTLSGSGFSYIKQKIARVIEIHKLIADLNGGTSTDSSIPLEEVIRPLVSVDNPLTISLQDFIKVNPPAGKEFSHFEIEGQKYAVGDEYIIDNTKDVTIKWIWKDVATSNNVVNNPATGDNKFLYVSLFGLCLLGLSGALIYKKRRI